MAGVIKRAAIQTRRAPVEALGRMEPSKRDAAIKHFLTGFQAALADVDNAGELVGVQLTTEEELERDGIALPIPADMVVLADGDVIQGGVCRVCGCTDLHACEGGCFWVAPDLCSVCFSEMHDDEELG